MAVPAPDRELSRLQAELKSRPRVILISGPSQFFRDEAVELALATVPAEADLRRIDGGESSDGRELHDLQGASLFGSGTWLCVRRGEGWVSSHGEAIVGLLPKIAEGCGLVLEVQKLDKRTKAGKGIAQQAASFEFRELYAEPFDRSRSPLEAELVRWLVQRAHRQRVMLTPEAAFLVVSTVGKDPAELVAELGRLAQRLPQGRPIAADDLRGALTVSFESTPFEFADALLAFDRRRAMRSLEAMFDRGIRGRDGKGMEAGGMFPFVTSWLWNAFMSAHHGRCLLDDGVRADRVAAEAGVRTFVDRFRAQVEGNPERRLRHGLTSILAAQRELRSSGEEPRAILERFVARYFAAGSA